MNVPVDVTNIRIETDRLILRACQESDLVDFYEYASVDGVGQMCGWPPHKNLEESRMVLDFLISKKQSLSLELKENSKVIGSVTLKNRDVDLGIPDEQIGRDISYVLSKKYWGMGLMPEAVGAVIDYCFQNLCLDYLTCGHFVQNVQSRRVIEKTGFTFLKEVKTKTRYGTVEDTLLYIRYNNK